MRPQLRPLSLAVVLVLLALTAVGAWVTRTAVRDQESRLLKERTNEVGLVLTSSIGSLPGPLDVLGGVLRATHESAPAFDQASTAAEQGSTATVTFALLRRTSGGFVVVLASGPGLHRGQVITDRRDQAFAKALTTTALVPTAVIGSGAGRSLGFALGPPVAPAGTVLYREDLLGPVGAPRSAGTAPFSELNVVIYASTTARRSQVLATTTNKLPLTGLVRTQPLAAGDATWTLQASAAHPLVGGTAAAAPWIVLGVGVFLSLLVALVIEAEARRRRAALALYDSEHRVAETLQLSLLPTLPTIAGLGLAARYLPGAAHQEIGGDWFDVFELDDGRIGVVIGDVVGHDIAAAAAMSKLQASLRAYAWGGLAPGDVLDRLDSLIATFDITELATVFYGVLDLPDAAGGRVLRYANGGHLPPFVHHPDGRVEDLGSPTSLLLGAPRLPGNQRPEGEARLLAGSILLLFTDGLVEAPGESLTTSLGVLRDAIAAARPGIDADALCNLALAGVDPEQLRDDVAILTVGLQPAPSSHDAAAGSATPVSATAGLVSD